ncbi:hypothetical protein ABW21_db0204812 [Orbilia brochopaga]|nr:hypothetical protein ABW21_db0204812 [Drechslerella brochopaga]
MARISKLLPLYILTATTHAFYLGISQYSAAPEIRQFRFPSWWNCNHASKAGATVLGFAIYNNAKQTHYPTAIAFFHDPSSQCFGEPAVIVTVSHRYGLFLVDFVALGIESVYTSWRLYDAEANRNGLQLPAPGSEIYNELPALRNRAVEGYAEGNIDDLVFERNVQTGNWEVVAVLRDIPLPPGGRYTPEYVAKYGEVPEEPSRGVAVVIPYLTEKLQAWADEAAARGPDEQAAKYAAQLGYGQGEAVQSIDQLQAKVGSMQYMSAHLQDAGGTVTSDLDAHMLPSPAEVRRAQANLPPNIIRMPPPEDPEAVPQPVPVQTRQRRPVRLPIPLKVRMRTLLQANAQGRVIFPGPDTLFGQPFALSIFDPEVIDAQLAQYTTDLPNNEVEFGWALLRAAENKALYEDLNDAQTRLDAELEVQHNAYVQNFYNGVDTIEEEELEQDLSPDAGDEESDINVEEGANLEPQIFPQRSFIEQRLEDENFENAFRQKLRQYGLGSPRYSELSPERELEEGREPQFNVDDILHTLLQQYNRVNRNPGQNAETGGLSAAQARRRQRLRQNTGLETAEIAIQTSPQRADAANNIQSAADIAEQAIAQPAANSELQSAPNVSPAKQNAGAGSNSQSGSEKFPSPEKVLSQQSRSSNPFPQFLGPQNLASGRSESVNSREALARLELGLEPEKQSPEIDITNLQNILSPGGASRTAEENFQQFQLDLKDAGFSDLDIVEDEGGGQGPTSPQYQSSQEGAEG